LVLLSIIGQIQQPHMNQIMHPLALHYGW